MRFFTLSHVQTYWLKHIALAALIAGILFSIKHNDKQRIDTSIMLIDLQENSHKLEEWKGKWVILNFWATWCQPCREEIPSFIKLQSEFKDNNLQVIGIAIDQIEDVNEFVKSYSFNYPILIGQDQAISLAVQLGNQRQGLPFTVLISPSGKVLNRHLGAINHPQLQEFINPYKDKIKGLSNP
ncbi:MAG: TlpA family protein disulfide reductase [Methylomonas sp.]